MDRRDRSRSRASSASMAALAAAAAAGEVGAENGTVAPMDEDQKPPASLGGPSSPAAAPTAAVPVSARRGAAPGVAAGGGGGPSCQAERCGADLTDARRYHRRHKVCEAHAKAPVVIVAGLRQRFCQQCSRFHELSEFDDIKKSCRKRLAGHNERRRKSTAEPNSAGTAGDSWRHGDQDGRGHPAGNPQVNNLQIR